MKEKLLIKRVKIIADFPGRCTEIGSIIECTDNNFNVPMKIHGKEFFFVCEIGRMENLFEPLPWWAERNINEMPEYVKLINVKPSYGLLIGSIRKVTQWEQTKFGTSWLCDLFPCYVSVNDLEPSTEIEYQKSLK